MEEQKPPSNPADEPNLLPATFQESATCRTLTLVKYSDDNFYFDPNNGTLYKPTIEAIAGQEPIIKIYIIASPLAKDLEDFRKALVENIKPTEERQMINDLKLDELAIEFPCLDDKSGPAWTVTLDGIIFSRRAYNIGIARADEKIFEKWAYYIRKKAYRK